MGKKKDKKERKRRERAEAAERADVERLLAEARAEPIENADPAAEQVPVPPRPAASASPAGSGSEPSSPVELEPSGPFPGVTPPAVLRRASPRPIPGAPASGPGMPVAVAARDVVSRLSGAALCYGEPVTAEGRTVIPVGKVRARGGMGFGGNSDGAQGGAAGSGGGGGGMLNASPLGYIEVTPEGTSFTPISSGRTGGGAGAGLALLAGAAAGLAGAALAARRRTPPAGLRRLTRRSGR